MLPVYKPTYGRPLWYRVRAGCPLWYRVRAGCPLWIGSEQVVRYGIGSDQVASVALGRQLDLLTALSDIFFYFPAHICTEETPVAILRRMKGVSMNGHLLSEGLPSLAASLRALLPTHRIYGEGF